MRGFLFWKKVREINGGENVGSVFDELKARGLIEQTSGEENVRALLEKEEVTFYSGFDPTADSLTVGHFVPIMAAAHLQRAGHRPIVLLGGGTGLVGDPTGKTEMRRMLYIDEIQRNCDCFAAQFSKYLNFGDGAGLFVNNKDWLKALNYVDFVRDIGVHFTVNRMLAADCYKTRYEKGLSFLEFNYMLMQSYDFLHLYKNHGCTMEFGGNDQWSNIIGGVELVRRAEGKDVYGMTFSLLTTSDGAKMGKTQSGAIWIDPNKTSPHEFFQYLRNIDDADVRNCLSLLTFLPMDEVERLSALKDSEINRAKEILAYEVTKIVHGAEEADKALSAAKALFSGFGAADDAPSTIISASKAANGINIVDALELCGLIPTRSEGRRLIAQGAVNAGGQKVPSFEYVITAADFKDGRLMLQKGKKAFHQLILGD
jgi:tyrosyl-tRNA synthetase